MALNALKPKFYLLTYQYHRYYVRVWWVPFAVGVVYSLLAAFIGVMPAMVVAWLPLLFYPVLFLTILGVATLFVWLLFAGWYSIWFRYLMWYGARGIGNLWRWLRTGWRSPIILLILASLLVLSYHLALGNPYSPLEFLQIEFWLKVVGVIAFIGLSYWVYQIRKRPVIQAFTNHTGDQDLTADVEGIASRLKGQLVRLEKLYETVDETKPELSKENTGEETFIDAAISVGDDNRFFQGTVSSDSTVSLGPFLQIPVGAITAILDRFVQGPQLSGSLHKETDDKLILIAEGRGSYIKGHWYVSADDLDCDTKKEKKDEILCQMIEQLAYRIFTGSDKVKTPIWRAVRHYIEGMRLYRETLCTKKDRLVNLRRAEQAFIQALGEDNQFAECHYNLGIIYRNLGIRVSAEAVFRRVIEEDPNHYKAHYALALNNYEQKRCADAILHCEQAIKLQPNKSEAWHLKGILQDYLEGESTKSVVSALQTATMLAWRQLCRSALRGERPTDSEVRAIALYLSNLAITYEGLTKHRTSKTLLRQAICLNPTWSWPFFDLGKIFYDNQDFEQASQAFEDALRREKQPLYWAYLADTYAELYRKKDKNTSDKTGYKSKAQDACRYVLEDTSNLDFSSDVGKKKKILELIKNALKQIDEPEDNKAIGYIRSIPDFLEQLKDNKDNLSYLLYKLRDYKDWKWGSAQIYIKLAERHQRIAEKSSQKKTKKKHLGKALYYFKVAIGKLFNEHLGEIRGHDLLERVVSVCQELNKSDQVLFWTEKAKELDPEHPWERSKLGDVYFTLQDYAHAEEMYNMGLSLGLEYSSIFDKIADTYGQRWFPGFRPETTQQIINQYKKFLNKALEIEESHPLDNPAQIKKRGYYHYYLGQAYAASKEYEQAISHLKMAQEMDYKPIESRVDLGRVYIKTHAYDAAGETFRETLKHYRQAQLNKDSDQNNPPLSHLLDIYLYSALAFAERGVNLKRALHRVRYAERCLTQIKDKSDRQIHRAMVHDYRGWIYLKQGCPDKAITEIEQAVELSADSDTYYHLACAYLKRANTGRCAGDLDKAREACDYARKTDWFGEYTQEIGNLLGQIEAVQRPVVSPAVNGQVERSTTPGRLTTP